jgi:hypothetical protein
MADDEFDEIKFKQVVDMSTFSQVLAMDDEGECQFSLSMVLKFFNQGKNTLPDMENALQASPPCVALSDPNDCSSSKQIVHYQDFPLT